MRYRETLTVPITLDRDAATPLHEQLAGQLIAAIRAGSLAPGTRMPSTRTLSTLLGVSRGVAATGYDLLVARGFAEGREGSGTYVTEPAATTGRAASGQAASGQAASGQATAGQATAGQAAAGQATAGQAAAGRAAATWTPRIQAISVDLTPGRAEAEFFPLAAWRSAWRRASCQVPSLDALPALGLPELRAAVAGHLLRTRGLVPDGHEIVVTSGVVPGLRLVLDALGHHADSPVAVEEHGPGWLPAVTSAAVTSVAGPSAGRTAVALPVDAEGTRIGAIPAAARVAVITTEGHTAHGRRLSPRRRAEAIQWIARTGGTVVEMACDAVLRPGGHPRLLNQAPENTVLVGGFCQVLCPTLRLGYLVVPSALAPRLARLVAERHEQPPYLTQLAVAQLLADGTVLRLMHRRGLAHRHKRGTVQEVLRGLGPRFRVDGLDAAGTVVLRLPAGPDAAAVARALDDRGIRVHPEGPRRLLLGYGHLPDAELRTALDALVRALWAILAPSQDLVAA